MSNVESNTAQQTRMREVAIHKEGHRYVLRYRPGQEAQALAHLSELAHDPHSDLDWRDIALLGRQIGIAIKHAYRKQTN